MSTVADKVILDSYLKRLRLSTFLEQYESVALEAAEGQESYVRFLKVLAEQEIKERERRQRQRRLKEAKLPIQKELQSFDFSALPLLNKEKIFQLARGEYMERAEPVILIGNPGLGKTHIATGLAFAATQQMKRVRFFNSAALVNELILAQQENEATALIHKFLKYDLIVLDELGFIPFSTLGAHLIFQFCSALYERVAMMVTTNLTFSDWTQVFGDETLTVALLDRLTHRAHIIEFIGDSYRFRERLNHEGNGSSSLK